MSNLSAVIKSIQDVMRQDSGLDGDAQRISQLTWLLFLKVFDALEEELELTRDDYRSPIPERMRWRQWAADAEGITGEALLSFIDNELFVTLKSLNADPVRNPRGYVVRGVFEDAYNYMKSGQLLRQVINKLNGIDFNRQSERHQFNDLYEKILKDLQSAGNAGEFYTPRAVTQFMVDMVNPQLGEKVFDPATGTGGFLVCAIEHLRRQVHNTAQEAQLQNSILGVEKKQLPHMLCVTNLMLHGIEVPSQVRHDNTLARPLRDYSAADRVDVVLTNPPFGGIEEPGIEQGFPADVRTKETADLFLVLIKQLLKHNGRAALVLPDGTLFGEGVKTRIKEQLLADCNLHTIVRLPNGVFAPYTGIKTNLLFFTKGTPTRDIWYYEHPYPPGAKSYNKTKPIRIEEFDAEKAWWGSEADGFAARVENERAWKVDIATIQAANYNLDQKNPHAPDTVSHDPDQLLADYTRLQAESQTLRDQLKAVLAQSLGAGAWAANWQRVSDHFDLLLDRPEAVDALEQTILQLAVRGLLVPQDPTDEPASVLLQKIRAEKDRLIAAGKIKRDKPLPVIANDEMPFELQELWEWVRVGDVVEMLNGYAFKSEWFKITGIRLLRNVNISHGQIDWSQPACIESASANEFSSFDLKVGDIVLSLDRPIISTGLKYAVVKESDLPCLLLQRVARLSPHAAGISASFFVLWLQSDLFVGTIDPGRSNGVPHISTKQVASLVIGLPPLAEQARIVARVTQLRSLCANLRQCLSATQKTQSRLAEALVEI